MNLDAAPQYRLAGSIGGDGAFAESLRGIAIDAAGHVWAAGDAAVKAFEHDGTLLRQWPTARPAHAVAVDSRAHVWVGEPGQVEIFDAGGARLDTWRPAGLGLVTAIGFGRDVVFLGDAQARWIHRLDPEGRLLDHIGDHHRKGGFHIPNGVIDFAIDAQGTLHVANPGMHRVERYTPDGRLLGHFGRFSGDDPAGFGGCCNPTNVVVDAAGRVIVSEKAAPRAKLYDPEGRLLAIVADAGFDPAAKNMDLAVDRDGRIYVADTVRRTIRVYAPVGSA